jgi:hypothetical protein
MTAAASGRSGADLFAFPRRSCFGIFEVTVAILRFGFGWIELCDCDEFRAPD